MVGLTRKYQFYFIYVIQKVEVTFKDQFYSVNSQGSWIIGHGVLKNLKNMGSNPSTN